MNTQAQMQAILRLVGVRMDTQAQRQAIVDRLTGQPLETLPSSADLDEPWRTIYRRTFRAAGRAEAETLIRHATEGLEGRRQLARDLIALLPEDDAFNPFPSLHDASEQVPPVDWLWPAWIPRGTLTLFGAAPGAGKSLVALDLARRLIHGEPFPDGAPVPCPGRNVLIVDAEGPPALLDQRARAWQIDSRRLFVLPAPGSGDRVDLTRQSQLLLLAEMCLQIGPALIVVDSLAAAAPRAETSLPAAHTLLDFLATIAQAGRFAILIIHHLRKRRSPGHARPASHLTASDLRGSSHLAAAARSILALSLPAGVPTTPGSPLLVPEPEDAPASTAPQAHPPSRPGELRRLEVVKTNLCRQPPPLGLIFEGQDMAVPTLRYTEYIEPSPPSTQLDLCARWILQFLAEAGEPVKPADVVRAATEMGFPRRTLYRARQALGAAILDLGSSLHDPHKRWTLAPIPPPTPGSPIPGSTNPE
jgi:hypothetical protein